ncbi:biopolymer transporter ExbD [Marinicauda algicola]|uniref:Biopolymer transporter ExbD n=1 Tax=Marinicauda algicola TaxID=2029849 RepID=A0A4S2GZ90_9PROT|nr:biopolymer transporter ExbD [Marinicauda algicola]TGY88515.1 biopolymer transporter ExbD [Marinicauda algicola]
MRRRNRGGDDKAEVNMTPMLDIVFILLIFFIVTATFLQEEGIDMRPPPPPPEDQPQSENPVILVQIDENNNVFVNQDRTGVDRVFAAVSRIRAEQPGSAVLIQPDDESHHGITVGIWDQMKVNGVPVSIQREDEA